MGWRRVGSEREERVGWKCEVRKWGERFTCERSGKVRSESGTREWGAKMGRGSGCQTEWNERVG